MSTGELMSIPEIGLTEIEGEHLLSPTGGYGLNTGFGDVINIAWKLQAVLEGWARPELLSTYGNERKPIFQRNGAEATHNRAVMREFMLADRQLASPAHRAEAIGKVAASKPRHGKHFDGMGVYLGDRYDTSSIIVADEAPMPSWDAEVYRPSGKPGGGCHWYGPTRRQPCTIFVAMASPSPLRIERSRGVSSRQPRFEAFRFQSSRRAMG